MPGTTVTNFILDTTGRLIWTDSIHPEADHWHGAHHSEFSGPFLRHFRRAIARANEGHTSSQIIQTPREGRWLVAALPDRQLTDETQRVYIYVVSLPANYSQSRATSA